MSIIRNFRRLQAGVKTSSRLLFHQPLAPRPCSTAATARLAPIYSGWFSVNNKNICRLGGWCRECGVDCWVRAHGTGWKFVSKYRAATNSWKHDTKIADNIWEQTLSDGIHCPSVMYRRLQADWNLGFDMQLPTPVPLRHLLQNQDS